MADVAFAPSILAHFTHPLCQGFVIGHDSSGITQCTEVLRGIEAEGGRMAEGANLPASDRGSMRLRAVFDDGETMGVGNGQDGLHRGRLSVEVHWQEGLRPG
jgi:hypothetical protein